MVIGVISDTHGRLDPAVEEVFAGVDHIFHAGDVGDAAILRQLEAIAPLTAVRGNCDDELWGLALPAVASEVLDGVRIVMVHDRTRLDVQASPQLRRIMNEGYGVLIHGHTHAAGVAREQGVLSLNPGSAGMPRYGAPRSVALLRINDGETRAVIRPLARGPSPEE
ncbi:MAG: metallophosphoesterase family protein [Acidobacteriota bacterium]|nr:metallophosphoesterase family protein [Acidobacteriota bacterium]